MAALKQRRQPISCTSPSIGAAYLIRCLRAPASSELAISSAGRQERLSTVGGQRGEDRGSGGGEEARHYLGCSHAFYASCLTAKLHTWVAQACLDRRWQKRKTGRGGGGDGI
ncbi:hypothetical protein E2562_001966 [Oryza meyeriana var. granulata]|uniref:Uncharacterized protein n=1 Tax=Oryza meyeriana var. granulata TaxID=110450 RepID=A0A6G1C536_9ORYZ|nr:hypothetical protein E2562_001966 [Oryza meyeriana var. granulata]